MTRLFQHRRWPAVAILLAVVGLGWATLPGHPAQGGRPAAGALTELEIAIASEQASAADWFAYAESLWLRGQYADSAAACQEVLQREPYHREAKFRCGLALAAAGRAEEFYRFMRELAWSEPKLAVDLFARAETRPYLGDERLRVLQREARNQAMD